MVKSNDHSTFELLSLNQIRRSRDIILQIEKTESKFSESDETFYLCEVVTPFYFKRSASVESLTDEVVRLNKENRTLRNKVDRLAKEVEKGRQNGRVKAVPVLRRKRKDNCLR